MFYALSWFLILFFFGLWSLTVWAANAVALWTIAQAGTWNGMSAGTVSLALPDWLALWVPPELAQALTAMLAGVAPMVESLLQSTPALAGGITVAAWVVWALGGITLLLLGAGLHMLIAMWRRRSGGAAGGQPARRIAA
jgi:hypothetical protein